MPRTSNCSPDSLAVGGSSYPLIQASVETHYELGLTIGRAACPRIRSWLKAYTALQAVLLPFVATQRGAEALSALSAASCAVVPAACEELRGLADGAGVAHETLMVMSLRHELSSLASVGSPPTYPECTDVLAADGAFAHNEDGHVALRTTAYYVNASVQADGSHHLALHYPASLAGHAFGFNGAGLALSMNAVFPRAVDTHGAGGYFLTRAALDAPNVDALVAMLRAVPSASGASLNVGSAVECCTNIEIGPGRGRFVVSSGELHMNEYLHLDVPFVADVSSEHRLARARQIVAATPPRVANLTTLWAVLGDTLDPRYPLYRDAAPPDDSATAATATFQLSGPAAPMLMVHEKGNPLDGKTKVVRFEVPRPLRRVQYRLRS